MTDDELEPVRHARRRRRSHLRVLTADDARAYAEAGVDAVVELEAEHHRSAWAEAARIFEQEPDHAHTPTSTPPPVQRDHDPRGSGRAPARPPTAEGERGRPAKAAPLSPASREGR